MSVVYLGYREEFRKIFIVLVCTFILSAGIYWWCKRKIMLFAGDLLSPGHIEIMETIVNAQGYIVIFYLVAAGGYR